MLEFASLGSGSQGNATVVRWAGGMLLLDCGFTVKATEARLERLGVKPTDIHAILVTHEHGDHIGGVGPLARKYDLPVYLTEGTFQVHQKKLGRLPCVELIRGYAPFTIEGMNITPVAVPHDAREPAQFLLHFNGLTLGILTDLGLITPHVEEQYAECDGLLVEANHDSQMLASGPYHASLKRRVSGPWGHLNNQQTAQLLSRISREQLQQLVVGHISQKNNALELVKACLTPWVSDVGQVHYACQDEGFDWLTLR